MITTVVFDLDDTLYDEVDYCRSGFAAVARFLVRFSDCPCTEDAFACLWRHFTAGNRTNTFNATMDELGIPYDEHRIAQLVEVYRGHRPDIELPADSRRTLEALRDGYTLALLTDGFLPAQRLKVEALGIASRFRAIVYTEELGRPCGSPHRPGSRSFSTTWAPPPTRWRTWATTRPRTSSPQPDGHAHHPGPARAPSAHRAGRRDRRQGDSADLADRGFGEPAGPILTPFSTRQHCPVPGRSFFLTTTSPNAIIW